MNSLDKSDCQPLRAASSNEIKWIVRMTRRCIFTHSLAQQRLRFSPSATKKVVHTPSRLWIARRGAIYYPTISNAMGLQLEKLRRVENEPHRPAVPALGISFFKPHGTRGFRRPSGGH
jgi:hypothetical protein